MPRSEIDILCFEEHASVMSSLHRQLERHFGLRLASNARSALDLAAESKCVRVLLMDPDIRSMPLHHYLSRFAGCCPNTVHVFHAARLASEQVLTAVNQPHFFRLIQKPSPAAMLAKTLDAAMLEFANRLQNSDFENRTYAGCLTALAAVLRRANRTAYERATRLRRRTINASQRLPGVKSKHVSTAALLSQLACVGLPEEALKLAEQGKGSTESARILQESPKQSAALVSHIPPFEEECSILNSTDKEGGDVALEVSLLKSVLAFDALIQQGVRPTAASNAVRRNKWYRPELDATVQELSNTEPMPHPQAPLLDIDSVRPGMILDDDVYIDDLLLLPIEHQLTSNDLRRLKVFVENRKLDLRLPVRPVKHENFSSPDEEVGSSGGRT